MWCSAWRTQCRCKQYCFAGGHQKICMQDPFQDKTAGFPHWLVSFARHITPHILYICLCRNWEGINIALKISACLAESAYETPRRSYAVRSPAIIALPSITNWSCCQQRSTAGEKGLQLKQKHSECKCTHKHLPVRNLKTISFQIHCTQNHIRRQRKCCKQDALNVDCREIQDIPILIFGRYIYVFLYSSMCTY